MSRLLVPTTRTLIKSFATAAPSSGQKFVLPKLPYAYSALEPAISGQIMEVHHTKHHQAYVTNLNAALASYADAEQANDVQKMISLQPALRFHGGGHVNHSIFWTNLAPPKEGGGGKPSGELLAAIEASYGTFDKFKEQMSAQSIAVQGSGWGWLGYNKAMKRVEIITKPNQVSATRVPNTTELQCHTPHMRGSETHALTRELQQDNRRTEPLHTRGRPNELSVALLVLRVSAARERPAAHCAASVCVSVCVRVCCVQDPLTELVPLLGFDVWEHGQTRRQAAHRLATARRALQRAH